MKHWHPQLYAGVERRQPKFDQVFTSWEEARRACDEMTSPRTVTTGWTQFECHLDCFGPIPLGTGRVA